MMIMEIRIGKTSDCISQLESLCIVKAEEMSKTIDFSGELVVFFWTEDFPELIGMCKFSKESDGTIVFDIDFSQSTL